jgi:serine/threonine protein kinase
MSYCINPTCSAPAQNRLTTNFCMSCGAKILLKDRYRALELLGQGGFGKTFKAVDEDQPRKPLCVIKQFAFSNNHPETRQIALKLFYEEAQHLEALGKHDQIPELLAYFDVEGQPYLVQQFIEGQDLEQELATAGTFNQTKIRELLESLLPVLDFLHHQSPPVIHRDIKPANIIRRRSDGGLVLVDFGAAKQATQSMLAKTGTAIGSAEFAAPEQARRKPVFASDIYSLGVTCIYLLTQVSPFDLFDMNQDVWVWRAYLVNNPVDEKLGKILDKMIANVLHQRYQSAAEVLAALSQKASSPKGSTTSSSNSQKVVKPAIPIPQSRSTQPIINPGNSVDTQFRRLDIDEELQELKRQQSKPTQPIINPGDSDDTQSRRSDVDEELQKLKRQLKRQQSRSTQPIINRDDSDNTQSRRSDVDEELQKLKRQLGL